MASISAKKLSILGAILALSAAFLREIPLVVLPGGSTPAGPGGGFSLAMFATLDFEVFAWGTIAGGTVTLLANFSLEGLSSLALWGFLVIGAILAISGSSPHSTPLNGKAQRTIAALLLLADAGIFLILAFFFSPLGLTGLRPGWYFVTASGVLTAISARETGKNSE